MKSEQDILREDEVQAGFDRAQAGTVGAEEEYMLLRPGTYELVPEADAVLERVDGDERFTGELPMSQVEARTAPCRAVAEIAGQLAAARRDLSTAAAGLVELASAGVHPLAPPEGELTKAPRYEVAVRQYGPGVLRRQLVLAFQVHVAPGDSASSLAVYNSLRSYLPDLAAVAANAPIYGGADSALASVRPAISVLLPRQGVPPVFGSWAEYTRELAWGQEAGLMVRPGNWWWELRPRPSFGTLEVRVPDGQITVAEGAAVAALVHCLVMWLRRRHADGEELPVHPTWRIAENRWLAARDGVDAELADLHTGESRPVRERMHDLLEALAETASELGCTAELAGVETLLQANGAVRQRQAASEVGLPELPGWLARQFLDGV